jgi:hypothetical protein
MFKFFTNLFRKQQDQFGSRSPGWRKVREEFIADHPKCAACGTKNKLEVHHIIPFHIDPSLELDKNNLMTLCRNHHYTFGHFCDWTSWNKFVQSDVVHYNSRRVMRPHKKEYNHASPTSDTDSTFSYSFFSWNN